MSSSALVKGFEAHLKQMGKLGTYGDNMEISAFAREYGVDVRVYQFDFTYVIGPGDFVREGTGEESDYEVEAVYIAYHVGGVLSSGRKKDADVWVELGALFEYTKHCWTAYRIPAGPAYDLGETHSTANHNDNMQTLDARHGET